VRGRASSSSTGGSSSSSSVLLPYTIPVAPRASPGRRLPHTATPTHQEPKPHTGRAGTRAAKRAAQAQRNKGKPQPEEQKLASVSLPLPHSRFIPFPPRRRYRRRRTHACPGIWRSGSARGMEASAGLVAGSHNRNELVVIRRDGEPGVRPPRLALLRSSSLRSSPLILLPACSRSPWTSGTARCARFAATTWGATPTGSRSWPATSAPSPSAGTATSTSAARARRTAPSARPASSASRASEVHSPLLPFRFRFRNRIRDSRPPVPRPQLVLCRCLQGARACPGTRRRTASTTWRTSSTGATSTTPSTSPSPCSTPT
jgi:hypothetical protein